MTPDKGQEKRREKNYMCLFFYGRKKEEEKCLFDHCVKIFALVIMTLEKETDRRVGPTHLSTPFYHHEMKPYKKYFLYLVKSIDIPSPLINYS